MALILPQDWTALVFFIEQILKIVNRKTQNINGKAYLPVSIWTWVPLPKINL